MIVEIFSASVNPDYYNLTEISRMDFEEANKFFKEDTINACSFSNKIVDTTKPNEFSICADGANYGDGSDTMFVWVKVY